MIRFRKTFHLLIILFAINFNSYSQTKPSDNSEIVQLTKQALKLYNEGDFEKCFLLSNQSLNKAIAINDIESIAKNYRQIARVFYELSEFDKSIFFFNKALLFANKIDNNSLKIHLFNNLGNVYTFGINDYSKGISYYKNGLDLTKKVKDTSQIVLINLNLAWASFKSEKYKEGFTNLEIVNKYNDKYGAQYDYITIFMLNGLYYSNTNQFDLAQKYFQKGLDFKSEKNHTDGRNFLYIEYAKFLNKKGDYKKAYYYLNLSNEVENKIFNEKNLKNSILKGNNIEIDEYKKEINKIEIDKKNQSKLISKSKIINILAIIIIGIFGLLLFLLNRNSIRNQNNNKNLIKKNFQLKEAIEMANVANKVKSQFVSTISHELRTPLYGVIGITDIIYDDYKNLIDNKHLEALKFSAKYLLTLINDILQISKIEESEIVLEKTKFNILEEVNSICNALQFIAINNNVAIKTIIDSNIPKLLTGDQTRLSQILMNLITNSLKFTKNGTVWVILTLENFENNKYFINFKVKDTGIGIAPENQSKIFDKFTQIKRKDDDYQGTGLGLSIVKKLIDLFDSEIYLESELNMGTTISFSIGFDIFEEINNIPFEAKKNINSNLKFLVVEDNKINQIVTKKIIDQKKYTSLIVSSGFEAIEILKTEKFDIILMDINMPELNGFETTSLIRNMKISVPIIALTAYNKKQVLQQSIDVGIDAVLEKPYEPEKLFEIIDDLLEAKKQFLINDSLN